MKDFSCSESILSRSLVMLRSFATEISLLNQVPLEWRDSFWFSSRATLTSLVWGLFLMLM